MYKKKIFEISYKKHLGMISWFFHRLTGIVLIFYLMLHIVVLHTLQYGEKEFNKVMEILTYPIFKILEVGLLAIILYHTFNGIKVVAVDFFHCANKQKKLFVGAVALSIVIFILGVIPFIL